MFSPPSNEIWFHSISRLLWDVKEWARQLHFGIFLQIHILTLTGFHLALLLPGILLTPLQGMETYYLMAATLHPQRYNFFILATRTWFSLLMDILSVPLTCIAGQNFVCTTISHYCHFWDVNYVTEIKKSFCWCKIYGKHAVNMKKKYLFNGS